MNRAISVRHQLINQSVERYIDEMQKNEYCPITIEEEIELAKKIKKKDRVALDRLVEVNLRFVISVAKEYQGSGLPLQDLISAGNLGLIKAANRFDVTRGFRFISYAVWWIRQSILQSISEDARVVRLPLHRTCLMNTVLKAEDVLLKKLGRTPTFEELAEFVDDSLSNIYDVFRLRERECSLSSPVQGKKKRIFSDAFELIDVLDVGFRNDAEGRLDRESLQQEIARALSTLKHREVEVITLYFGLGREQPLKLEEIGTLMHLTRERVRQIKEKALQRLRHCIRAKRLRPFLE